MKNLVYILYPTLILLITGCFEKEAIVTPGEIEEVAISYSLYEYQSYFHLADETIIAYNHYSDWDMGFESSADGYHIILNSSRFMMAGKAGSTDFESVNSNTSDTLIYDDSSGDLEKTALKDWADFSDTDNPIFSGEVFIIDRGLDELGQAFGIKKLVVEKLEGGVYYLRFANLDGSEEYLFQVPKNSDVNFVLFSFDNGGSTASSQPPAVEWDLCFTKYSTIIFDNDGVPTPYIVRGVFNNNIKGVKVSLDTINSYYDIDINYVSGYQFSTAQDAIGYEWKLYENDTYTLVDGLNYIIEDQDGIYYKLRFTDYFNDIGQKGYPSFELSRLSQ